MPARIIAKPEGVDESNLVRTIQEQPVGTISPEIPALIARVYDRRVLGPFLRRKGERLEEIETNLGVDLNKVNFAVIGSTLINLRMGLGSLFLTRWGLRSRGIEPLALYYVKSDYSSFRKVMEYAQY